jgi:GNAT superfamily N-acetyltransferase
MIALRPGRPEDAAAIAAVHVAVWRSAYPALLPEAFLARLSVSRQTAYYDAAMRGGTAMQVGIASGADLPADGAVTQRIVGFAGAAPARRAGLAEGEIETLYVLDDWRERGLGRRLITAAAAGLYAAGCRSACLWVLRDNPSRWFYQHLGGKPAAEAEIMVGGRALIQLALVWNPIERLLATPCR